MIAEAAHHLGLEGLTLKAVADHLGVSIPALYHHVSSKDDLMRVAAEYAAGRVPLPEDRGQHWAVWLLEWARYNRNVFLTQPALLGQYLEGAISAESIVGNLDAILAGLVRQGFSVVEANEAYELVSTSAIGTAVGSIREREALAAGRGSLDSYRRVLDDVDEGALPHVRELLDTLPATRPSFAERITTVLLGIAVRHGRDWREVLGAIEAAAPPQQPPPKPAPRRRRGRTRPT
jgi:AcrR family transcriptional regulator